MKKLLLAVLAAGLLLGVGCSKGTSSAPKTGSGAVASASASPVFRSVSPSEAKAMIDQRKDLRVIDVRNPGELREGAIAGSRLIPFGSLLQGKHDLQPNQPVLLVCAVGGRSYAAGQILRQKGFREVYNLSGGMSAWKRAGLPVTY